MVVLFGLLSALESALLVKIGNSLAFFYLAKF